MMVSHPELHLSWYFNKFIYSPLNMALVLVGLTPLHVAVLSHNAVVQELLCGGTPPSAQSPALLQKRKLLSECIATLLLMGASLDTKVKVFLQPLQAPLCLMFPTHAFSPCSKQDRKSGRTALHMAAEEANIELLRLFLDQPSYFSVINAKVSEERCVVRVHRRGARASCDRSLCDVIDRRSTGTRCCTWPARCRVGRLRWTWFGYC